MRTLLLVLLWLAVLAVLWMTVASGAFLWLAGLWDSPDIVWWARPWQWLTYLNHGDGSLSEMLYLAASALLASGLVAATAPMALTSLWPRDRPPVYGVSRFADRNQKREGGIASRRSL